MLDAPCKDCPDRVVGCHGTCEKYIAFRKYRDELNERRIEENRVKDALWATSRFSKKKKRRRPYADRSGGY